MTADETKMVELLATARAQAQGTDAAAQRGFAGKVLCLVFDPVKANYPEHESSVRRFRSLFGGVSTSHSLQELFVEGLTPTLLGASTLEDAISHSFDDLMRTPLTEGEA